MHQALRTPHLMCTVLSPSGRAQLHSDSCDPSAFLLSSSTVIDSNMLMCRGAHSAPHSPRQSMGGGGTPFGSAGQVRPQTLRHPKLYILNLTPEILDPTSKS